jgi:hypothetical protein
LSQVGRFAGLSYEDSNDVEEVKVQSSGSINRSRMTTFGVLLPGIVLAFSAALKLFGPPTIREQMATIGFAGGKLVLIAVLEAVSAALLLWPRTRSIGLLFASSYLGGAICAHVQSNEYVKALSPSMVLGLVWIVTWWRHPQVLWSARDVDFDGNSCGNSATQKRSA